MTSRTIDYSTWLPESVVTDCGRATSLSPQAASTLVTNLLELRRVVWTKTPTLQGMQRCVRLDGAGAWEYHDFHVPHLASIVTNSSASSAFARARWWVSEAHVYRLVASLQALINELERNLDESN